MLQRRIFTILFFLLLSVSACFSQDRAATQHKIDSLLPDNRVGVITPARLRAAAKILIDYAESIDTASIEIGNRKIKGMLDVQRGPLSILMGGRWADTTRSVGQYNGGMIGVSSYYPGTQLLIMGSSLASGNFIKVGGGEADYMAANSISEYTTATPGATIGSIRRYVFGSGRHWFGSGAVDDGINLVTVNGATNIKGALTTHNIAPVSTGKTIGSSSLNYSSVWSTAFLAPGGGIFGTNSTTSAIGFRQGPSSTSNLLGGFFASGRMYVQPNGVEPIDNGTDQLQVIGSANFTGAVRSVGVVSSAPWSSYQASFGSSGEGGRIQFIRGADGVQGFRMGFVSSTANQVEAFTGSSFTLTGGLGLSLLSTSSSANTIIGATGSGATVRIQTGAAERVRVHPDGAVTFDPSGAHVNTGLYNLDNIGNLRTTGSFTLNDGTISKSTGGQFVFGASLATGNYIRANAGILAGSTGGEDGSAILEAKSTTKGMLPPRMSETQKNAISTPATGLIVYQLDGSEGIWVKTSTGWKQLAFVP